MVNPAILPDAIGQGDAALDNSDTDEAICDYSLFILLNLSPQAISRGRKATATPISLIWRCKTSTARFRC